VRGEQPQGCTSNQRLDVDAYLKQWYRACHCILECDEKGKTT
jgi:hypothetical protein